jgi:hypothetical protein
VTIGLYFDEDSSRAALVRELRARGADVTSAVEAETLGRTDQEQLEWVASNERALFSFNRSDFAALHATWVKADRSHHGVILSRQDLSVGEQMRRLLRLLATLTGEEMRNRIEFLSGWA